MEAFLARHKLDGGLSFRWAGHWMFLRDIIAHCRLPQDHEVEGISLDWLVERLEPFALREYSIASLPGSGRMELLVRKAVKDDGSLGLGSGWLTDTSTIGGVVSLRLRPNPNFHPPAGWPADVDRRRHRHGGSSRPSSLSRAEEDRRCLAAVRRAQRRRPTFIMAMTSRPGRRTAPWRAPTWSFRARARRENMSSSWWRTQGAEIARWVERGASILVCGGLKMAAGVEEALVAILGEERLDRMTQDGLYRRDIY